MASDLGLSLRERERETERERYFKRAVKQGSAAIGLRSKSRVVLAYVNKSNSELSSHQKKIFKADDHIGVAIVGLTADGRVLSRYFLHLAPFRKLIYSRGTRQLKL